MSFREQKMRQVEETQRKRLSKLDEEREYMKVFPNFHQAILVIWAIFGCEK